MKVTKLKKDSSGNSQLKAEGKSETFIIRNPNGLFWIANSCDTPLDCSDNNSCCVNFKKKKDLLVWLRSFE